MVNDSYWCETHTRQTLMFSSLSTYLGFSWVVFSFKSPPFINDLLSKD